MVKTINNPDKVKVNVFLKDGSKFLNRDVAHSTNDRIFAFWHDNLQVIIGVSITDISSIEMYEENVDKAE